MTTSQYDEPVTFAATVTGAAGSAVPAGVVLFSDAGRQLGAAPVLNGAADFTTRALAVGGRAITAAYEGTDSYKRSSSELADVTVMSGGGAATNPQQDASHDNSDLSDSFSPATLHAGWTTKIPGTGASSPNTAITTVLAVGDLVFTTSHADVNNPAFTLSALSASDGSVLWQDQSENGGQVVYDGGLLFIGQTAPDGTRTVAAIDAADGDVVWQEPMPQDADVSGLTSFDGTVYLSEGAPATDGAPATPYRTIGLREADGAADYNAAGAYGALLSVNDAGVYAASNCGDVDTDASGSTAWARSYADCPFDAGGIPALAGQGLFAIATPGGSTQQPILDPTDGDTVGNWDGRGYPSFDAGHRFEVSATGVSAVATSASATGWSYTSPFATANSTGFEVYADAALATEGMVFVRDVSGKIHGLDSNSGQQLWSALPPGGLNEYPSTTAVTAGGGRVYAATNGVLTAYLDGTAASVTLGTSSSAVGSEQPVTLTAHVTTGDGGTPSGRVLFVDGPQQAPVGDALLDNGVATLQTSALVKGSRQLTAIYEGDETYARELSPAVSVTVMPGIGVAAGPLEDAAHDGSDLDDTFDANTFGQRWTINFDPSGDSGRGPVTTAIGPGRVYATISANGKETVDAFSTADGSMIWADSGDFADQLVYDGGRVFVEELPASGYQLGKLDAYDAATGELDWSMPIDPGALTAYDGALYVRTSQNFLPLAIIAQNDGTQIGAADVDSYGQVSVDDTGIYSGGCGALKTTFGGTDIWSFAGPALPECEHTYANVLPIHGGFVYTSYTVLAADTGQPTGRTLDGGTYPSFDDDNLYQAVEPGTDGSPNGAGITATVERGLGAGWHSPLGGAPTVATNGIVFTAANDSIIGLRSSDGQQLIGENQPDEDQNTVSAGGGIVLLTTDSTMTAYGPPQ